MEIQPKIQAADEKEEIEGKLQRLRSRNGEFLLEQVGDKIKSKINEAEVYYSMGLYSESLGVYEQILVRSESLDEPTREDLEHRIETIREKIAAEKENEHQPVSAQDIPIIRETFSSQNNVSEVLDSAFAFRELGLYAEAVCEYEKLFRMGHPPQEVISEISKCLLRIHSPSEVVRRVEELLEEYGVNRQEAAGIRFSLGEEMEQRGQKGLALELYRSAKGHLPADRRINKKLDALVGGLSSGGKYEYLLNQKMLSRDHLGIAAQTARESGKTVESVLLQDFGIKKEDLGKSLSLFYGCSFREFDSKLSPPPGPLRNLKKAFLLHERWVPLAETDGEVEILIDDPWNLSKIDQIRSLLKTKSVSFSVALQEDIEKFIHHFFDDSRPEPYEKSLDEGDTSPPSGEVRGRRRHMRFIPKMPEFVYAEFRLGRGSEGIRTYRLNVINYSRSGLGLVLNEKDSQLLDLLNPGDKIENITFYATWAMINAPAVVRHKTKMKDGVYKDQYVIGVESKEILESSVLTQPDGCLNGNAG